MDGSNRFLERGLFFRKGYACELEDMVDQIMKLIPRKEDAGKTPLAMLKDVNEIVHDTTRPIKRVSFVLNDLDLTSSKLRYGYGHGYGYGYGYGDDGKKRKLHCRKAGIR